MRHVNHDRVERHGGRAANDVLILSVVEVQGNRDAGRAAGVGGEVHKETVGVGDGPGEEEDLGRRPFSFGGAHGGNDCFEVVL